MTRNDPIIIELDSLEKEFSIKDLRLILQKEIKYYKDMKAKHGPDFINQGGK